MMRGLRRILFYTILTAASAASLVWFVCVPRRPERMAWAVPEGARWVSLHRNPAARWEAAASHPLTGEMAKQMGIDEAAWAGAADSREVLDWVRRLASDEVMIARLPAGPIRHAWGLVSWIGGRAQRYRLLLVSRRPGGFEPFTTYRGRPVWRVRADWIPWGRHLTIAIEEGILLACLSENPSDIFRMLDAYDGVAPRDPAAARLADLSGDDRAIWNLGVGLGPDEVNIQLTGAGGSGIEGIARLTGWDREFPPVERPSVRLDPIANLLGGHPAAVAVLHPAVAEAIMAPILGALWPAEAWNAAREGTEPMLVVGLYGDALGGRFRGLRIPGLTLSAPLSDEARFNASIGSLLDRMNAARQWGLIRGPMPGAPELTLIEGTGAGAYATLPSNERIALMNAGGWTTVALSAETLRALAVVWTAGTGGPAAEWTTPPGQGDSGGWIWMDLERTCETIRHALAVHALKLQIEDRDGSIPARARIDTWRDALAAAGGFGHARLGLDPDGTNLTVRFRIDPERGRLAPDGGTGETDAP